MRIKILGFGSIGRGMVPMLLANGFEPQDITVFDMDPKCGILAREMGLSFVRYQVKATNYLHFLSMFCRAGDVLLNLAVDVSSVSLLQWCMVNNVHYLDTCVEPWAGGYERGHMSVTNHELRTQILGVGRRLVDEGHRTSAIIAHGANPGLISYFVKRALVYLGVKHGLIGENADDSNPEFYGWLGYNLGVRVVQIAEYDTQQDAEPWTPGAFHNTWSVPGFMSELMQTAEIGLGSHENLPGKRFYDCGAVGYTLTKPEHKRGYQQMVQTWTPAGKHNSGWLVTHHEALSVNALMTYNTDEDETLAKVIGYRPTVYYAYQPCPAARVSISQLPMQGARAHIINPTAGFDQMGALLLYDKFGGGGVWCGSTLRVGDHDMLHNPPTTMQVTASVAAGVMYMLQNPNRGVLESEDLPWREMLDRIRPYLGTVDVVETDWNPGGFRLQNFLID